MNGSLYKKQFISTIKVVKNKSLEEELLELKDDIVTGLERELNVKSSEFVSVVKENKYEYVVILNVYYEEE